MSSTSTATTSHPVPQATDDNPVVTIVIGMAGSGKTTLMKQLLQYQSKYKKSSYSINLDPAVTYLPYSPNIDIRDTVRYKDVMKQYGLGPNGGILTSLNLFATRFDQVLNIIDRRKSTLSHLFIDTPGQIEVFTWSASGTIITDSIASTVPTVLLYIVDTPRNESPSTFMSNMLYACSIMYKTQLPFLLVFNKSDVCSSNTIELWMNDIDEFTAALKSDESYMSSLTRSMSLVLNQFYDTIKCVSVSSITGDGFDTLFEMVEQLKMEYYNDYVPIIQQKLDAKIAQENLIKQANIDKLNTDLLESRGQTVVIQGNTTTDDIIDSDSESIDDTDYDTIEQRDNDERDYNEFMERLTITEQLQMKRDQRAVKQAAQQK